MLDLTRRSARSQRPAVPRGMHSSHPSGRPTHRSHGLFILCAIGLVVGCESSSDDPFTDDEAATGSGGSGGMTATTSSGGSGGDGSGGFSLGVGGGGGAVSNCDGLLDATIRDFSATHPDFETYTGTVAYTGLVQSDLGNDNKPVYAATGATPQTTGPSEFAQWYNDTNGVNQSFAIQLQLTETSPGEFTYDSSAFFPVDGMGFGNEGNPNNFHFTTELHTMFVYDGGEQFTFTGDDDLWMFINGRLAIDLGGLHPSLSATVVLDQIAGQLDITVGNTYPMDIFHAERHTDQSNFRIQTTISCFQPPPQ